MTPLYDRLVARIRADGPMTVATYMAEAMSHPQYGYYATRDPLGAAGDFTTAPEISQMFGELVGLALAQQWLDMGSPDLVRLVELGPGRGTLMADALRATSRVPGFRNAVRVHMIETSPALRALQAQALDDFDHNDRLEDVPDGPLLLIANEFFDALPVRQFVRAKDRWRERVVGLEGGTLAVGLSDPIQVPDLAFREADVADGDLVEVCAAGQSIAAEIGRRISADGGAALIIDYGDWRSLGDTLQAVQSHDVTDPLAAPGEADLTTHVDFEALAIAAAPAQYTALTTQGIWLERLGITARAQSLARGLRGEALTAHIAAHRRLTHPAEMGTLFKVLGLFSPTSSPPPGFVE